MLNMLVAVEKLPTWCFSTDYAMMGRSRELCQQLLEQPFNEVKARVVRFLHCGWSIYVIDSSVGRWYCSSVTSF